MRQGETTGPFLCGVGKDGGSTQASLYREGALELNLEGRVGVYHVERG